MSRATAEPANVPGAGGERGSASVEAAIAVCGLLVVLAAVIGGVAAMVAQVRCIDAAREAARLVARGESGRAEQAAHKIAPGDASVAVRINGDEVIVEVSTSPVGGLLPAIRVRAEAMAVLEPGAADSP